jgi:hypothetical protein
LAVPPRRPPVALREALSQLERQWGPKAFRTAVLEHLRKAGGRPREHSDRTLISVWWWVELIARGLKVPRTEACGVLARHFEIDDMTESVGIFSRPERGRGRWNPKRDDQTWRRLHAQGARILRREQEERTRREQSLDEMAPDFAKSSWGSFLYKDIQKYQL